MSLFKLKKKNLVLEPKTSSLIPLLYELSTVHMAQDR